MSNMSQIEIIECRYSENAPFALSPSSNNCYIAYVENGKVNNGLVHIHDLLQQINVKVIEAHLSPISYLSFSFDGTLLATSSDKGTVIRVFSIPSGTRLFQFRRGTYVAKIYSISFSPDNNYLCCSSDTDTVHIFKLDSVNNSDTFDLKTNTIEKNLTPVNALIPTSVGSLWELKRDFAFCKLPFSQKTLNVKPNLPVFNVCSMSADQCVSVANFDGRFYKFKLNTIFGGECFLLREEILL
ncbi:autophagy protein [Clydaea vesicula]|uniref:Autophagy protein n=1 Tax=Clydaea vesicula TaxID=447962 RepID=A0AAD5XUW3_9FUNG|nr:autophagy protein [Clydaea vesicula]